MRYRNPVIPGFHPDPSICRVGEDYYLVTSSFEYFPGVPVFHSRDLVHWRQIGHCLTRTSQLDLRGAGCSDGIWAPSIRHHGGRFYMVTTLVRRNPWLSRNFVVSADDPAGEWSEPVWLDEAGIDPSLAFEDGRCYYVRNGEYAIVLGEVDVASGRITMPPRLVWKGTGGPWPEGPHLYKINGLYYLMIAEGGTGYGHMVTIARSISPYGPYESCPRNPILTHRDRPDHPIQCTGHADLVQAHDGSWWMVFLGVRDPVPGVHSFHLGRETFLAPVRWDDDGWPIVGNAGTVELETDGPRWPARPWPATPGRDDFDGGSLGLDWNTLRLPLGPKGSLSERPGWLRLKGTAATLDSTGDVAFVGRRQTAVQCRAATLLEFEPGRPGEEAGVTVLMCDRFHYDLCVSRAEGGRQVALRERTGAEPRVVRSERIGAGPVTLALSADAGWYGFRCSVGGRELDLGRLPVSGISNERAGTFTGVYVGIYAAGDGRPCTSPADFDWFELDDA